MVGKEQRKKVPTQLLPMLDIERDGWELCLGGSPIAAVLLRYRSLDDYTVGVWYLDINGGRPFEVQHHGVIEQGVASLDEALDHVETLFLLVEAEANWHDIANFSHNICTDVLIDTRRFRDRYGIGRATITKMQEAFVTLERLKQATIDDIKKVPGIGADTAWRIASCFSLDVRYGKLWDATNEEWVKLTQVPVEVLRRCAETHTKLTREEYSKYRLTRQEIEERGLVKRRLQSK